MIQTIFQVGNSLAVTLPKDFTQKAKIRAGDKVDVDANAEIPAVYMRPAKNNLNRALTPEFKSWLDSVLKEDEEIIKALAKV